MRLPLLLAAILAASTALAAETKVPPSPIASDGDNLSLVAEAEDLAMLVEAARNVPGPSAPVQMPPAVIHARVGVTEVIPIARTHLNRLRTPFREPRAKTVSDASTSSEGGAIYVATNNPRPLNLYIYENDAPERAISVLLQPREIPPIDIELKLVPESNTTSELAALARPELAERWEQEQPYVDTIKTLFKELALGTVPPGYGLAEIDAGHPMMPNCWMPDVRISAGQLLEGASLVVLVARVENLRHRPVEIDEAACAAPGVLAVAAWPRVRLEAGESTELYIARRRPEAPTATARPSMVEAGR